MDNELLNYIFNECDFEYDRTRSNILSIDFPDYEDVVYNYDTSISKEDYDSAITTITEAINNADYWYCNNEMTDYLCLDANVDFEVDTDKVTEDEFWSIIEGYDSRDDIDVYFVNDGSDPIFYACAEFTLENLLKYDELVKEAEKLEKTLFNRNELIEEFDNDSLHNKDSLTDIEYEVMNIMKKFNKFKLSQHMKDYLCYWYNHISLDFSHFDSVNNTVECSLCLNPYVNSWINPKDEYPSYEDRKVKKYFNRNKEFIDYCNNLFKDCYKNGLDWNGNHSSLWFWGEKDIKLNELENYLILLNKDIEEFLKVDLDKFWSKRK